MRRDTWARVSSASDRLTGFGADKPRQETDANGLGPISMTYGNGVVEGTSYNGRLQSSLITATLAASML